MVYIHPCFFLDRQLIFFLIETLFLRLPPWKNSGWILPYFFQGDKSAHLFKTKNRVQIKGAPVTISKLKVCETYFFPLFYQPKLNASVTIKIIIKNTINSASLKGPTVPNLPFLSRQKSLPQDLHTMTLTTIHVWLLLLTWPTPAKHRHCSAMAAILQSAQWTTFWSYVIDRWAVGIWPADHITHDCTSK